MEVTYQARKSNGEVVQRRSAASYVAASQRQGDSQVRFHQSREAARRAAGRYGQVYAVEVVGGSAPQADQDSGPRHGDTDDRGWRWNSYDDCWTPPTVFAAQESRR